MPYDFTLLRSNYAPSKNQMHLSMQIKMDLGQSMKINNESQMRIRIKI